MTKNLDKVKSCVRFLVENGVDADEFTRLSGTLSPQDTHYELIEVKDDFFTTVAKGLRDLWPKGEKAGGYPWRDSVANLVQRLKLIWDYHGWSSDKYTVDECLSAGRRYLAQFEKDAKYMQTLKYFIFKQKQILGRDGKYKNTYESKLCDFLESQEPEAVDLFIFSEEGELV